MKSLIFACVCCVALSTAASAHPTIYGFEGYIQDVRLNAPALPQGFKLGVHVTGTFTFDPHHKGYDIFEDSDAIMPILKWEVAAENGDKLAGHINYSTMMVGPEPPGETFRTEAWREFSLQWHSNEVGQIAAIAPDYDLTVLDPNHWDAGITQAPDCPFLDPCPPEMQSNVYFHITSLWRKRATPAVAVSDFTNGASGWTVQSGQWSATNGYFRNSSNLEASIATGQATTTDHYGINAKMYLEWSAQGNQGGFVYDYVDANNYRGVLLSPGKNDGSGSSRLASIYLFEVRNGVRTVVAQKDGVYAYAHQWLRASIERIGTQTHVNFGGADVYFDQPIQWASKRAGLLARYNLVRYDDVVYGVTPRQ